MAQNQLGGIGSASTNPQYTVLYDGSGNAVSVVSLGSRYALSVLLLDASGNQITSFAGTEYTEGNTDASITGTAILWEDGLDTLRAVSAAKPMPVRIYDGTGADMDLFKRGDSYVPGNDHGLMILGVTGPPETFKPLRIEAAGADGESNTADRLLCEAYGAMFNGTTWDRIRGDITNGLDVDVTRMPGTGVEDAAETAGGTLVMAGTVRRDTAAASSGSSGDNSTLNTDSLGRLWISGAAVEDAAETAGGILLMAGTVRRDTAASSAGSDGDNATLNTDASGRLHCRGQDDVRELMWISSASSDVDNSGVLVFDASGADASCRFITVTNAGDTDLFVRVGGTDPVADGSTAYYDFKLAKGETRWIPIGVKTGTTNDVRAIRAAAQTNDNVIVAQWGFAA